MITLGINPFSHDSSAAIVKDGIIVAASSEERFNREKHSAKIPINAINFCIKKAGIKNVNEIQEISFGFNFLHWRVLWLLDSIGLFKIIPVTTRTIIKNGDNHFFNLIKNIFNIIDTRYFIRNTLKYSGKVAFNDHHDAHAASCYFPSCAYSAAIITVDGRGEKASTRIYKASGIRIKRMLQINYPHSLGLFYTAITYYLGFLRNCDEGKVMGLSSYGDSSLAEKMRRVIAIKQNGKLKLNLKYFDFWWNPRRGVSEKFNGLFGLPRTKKDPITHIHENIAKAAQIILEDSVMNLVMKAKQITNEDILCMAGGVTLNSVSNGKVIESDIFKQVYMYPASGDDGIAVGAAFLSYYKYASNQITSSRNKSPYLGYETNEYEIIDALKSAGVIYSKEQNIYQKTAQLLADGKFVGWFQGAHEFGPRALGNRSILADPRNSENKDKLNAKVKFREGFRPFAPSILKENAPEYFRNCTIDSPYMIVTFDVLEEKKKIIPSVTHIDGTARVQTVTREQNQDYYELLKAFNMLTGVPVLLNTSFNVMNEPIVCTPQQAINCFLNSGLDAVVIADYLVIK
ncbi:MAG: carbamoyl transferase [bacterium]|nr:carbamoyl transferase [bacterium]